MNKFAILLGFDFALITYCMYKFFKISKQLHTKAIKKLQEVVDKLERAEMRNFNSIKGLEIKNSILKSEINNLKKPKPRSIKKDIKKDK